MERITKQDNPWSIRGYMCKECNSNFGVLYFGNTHYCPYCGSKNIIQGNYANMDLLDDLYFEPEEVKPKTPREIADNIKEIYHNDDRDETKMEELLEDLVNIAEEKEGLI